MKVFLIALLALVAVAAAMPTQHDEQGSTGSGSGSGSGYPTPSVPPEFEEVFKKCQEDYTKCPEAWGSLSNYRPSVPSIPGTSG